MSEGTRLTPVEIEVRRRARRRCIVLLVMAAALAAYLLWRYSPDRAVTYDQIEENFKYGSIGSEPATGVPVGILKVLPKMFRDKLPGEGYASLGFLTEEGRDLPIGFSTRRVIIDRAWLNCGVCHTGTVRDTPASKPRYYTGMPANTMDLQALVLFLVDCASDERFSPERLLPEIEKVMDLGMIEKLLYRYIAIPAARDALLATGDVTELFARQPGKWGPGRVDTFNPYKLLQFNFPMDKLPAAEIIGVADLPSIWQQRKREGMELHWDGNNDSVEERNKSASLGAGVTPATLDVPNVERIEEWLLDLEPPAYPYEIDTNLAATGKTHYDTLCANCHGRDGRNFEGAEVGKIVPIEVIGTDPHRLDSYTAALSANQNTLYAGYPWRFSHFKKTNGYANLPLDGIWLRGPYLHNGSVPTLRDLLEAPENRPRVFYRGYDVIDREKVGFISTVAEEGGKKFFELDTALAGNGNGGHLYGIDLAPAEKGALVEYMKQF